MPRCTLPAAARNHPFAQESRDLLEQLPGSRARIFYSRPTSTDKLGVDFTDSGRLSRETIAGLGLPRDADAYLCGPSAFMNELGAGLQAYGLNPSRVYSEVFGAGAALTPGIAATSIPPHLPAPPPDPDRRLSLIHI